MDLTIPESDLALKRKAKQFAETWLFPHEEELELQGHLPPETLARLCRAVVEHGLNGINHSRENGGLGLSIFHLMLVSEKLGKAPGESWTLVWHTDYPLHSVI